MSQKKGGQSHLLRRNTANHISDEEDNQRDGISVRVEIQVGLHASDFSITHTVIMRKLSAIIYRLYPRHYSCERRLKAWDTNIVLTIYDSRYMPQIAGSR